MLAKWHRYRGLLPSCDTRCWRAELGWRHANLRREATAVLVKPASALLYDAAVWYLVWVCGRVGVWWWDERCDGFKTHVIFFLTEFFYQQIQSKKSTSSTGFSGRKIQSKKFNRKIFFGRVRKARLGLRSKKAVFDCQLRLCTVGNGLKALFSLLSTHRSDFYVYISIGLTVFGRTRHVAACCLHRLHRQNRYTHIILQVLTFHALFILRSFH